MRAVSITILLVSFVLKTDAFSSPSNKVPDALSSQVNKVTETIKNLPFFSTIESPSPPPPPVEPFDKSPSGKIKRALMVANSDFGVTNEDLLADEFKWIAPQLGFVPLSKDEYLTAAKFFNLRAAFPDLNYRAHDFRLVSENPLTVRVTLRTTGTMRGELKLRSKVLPPTGVQMICPPEAVSITFDEKGQVLKLCTGFTMDRLVGNTGGLCGVQGAAYVAGARPSEWEIYPPTVVLGRFFGRPVYQLPEPKSILSPFPESVLIQLAQGVIAAKFGTMQPSLLDEDFSYCGPFIGPLKKSEFIKVYSSFGLYDAIPDFDSDFINFRVDPFDPYRVWADGISTGTFTGTLLGKQGGGERYLGAPEAVSFTFNDDGFCTRFTAGAIMDPSLGNTGGLGGVIGLLYAVGVDLPGVSTRPLPQLTQRLQKLFLSPITKIGVNDFRLTKKSEIGVKEEAKPTPPPPSNNLPFKLPELPNTAGKVSTQPKPFTPSNIFAKKPSPPKVPPSKQKLKKAIRFGTREIPKAKKKSSSMKLQVPRSPGGAKEKIFVRPKLTMSPSKTDKKPVAKAGKQAFRAISVERKKVKPKPAPKKKQPEKPKPKAKPPKGVPVLKRWRKNRDNSIIGNVFSSASFTNGARITTSAIAKGEIAQGKVVQTESGSRYFLS